MGTLTKPFIALALIVAQLSTIALPTHALADEPTIEESIYQDINLRVNTLLQNPKTALEEWHQSVDEYETVVETMRNPPTPKQATKLREVTTNLVAAVMLMQSDVVANLMKQDDSAASKAVWKEGKKLALLSPIFTAVGMLWLLAPRNATPRGMGWKKIAGVLTANIFGMALSEAASVYALEQNLPWAEGTYLMPWQRDLGPYDAPSWFSIHSLLPELVAPLVVLMGTLVMAKLEPKRQKQRAQAFMKELELVAQYQAFIPEMVNHCTAILSATQKP